MLDLTKQKLVLGLRDTRKTEFTVSDVLKAFEDGAISREEARKILKNMGWPLEEGLNPS